MLRFTLSRIGAAVPVLFGVSVAVFAILHVIPGDPAQILLAGSYPTPKQLADLSSQLGLNKPLPVQYFIYVKHLLEGNLGKSFITNQAIGHEIAVRFPSTFYLTMAGMGVALAIGIPLGTLAGRRARTWIDHLSMGVAVLGVAIPYFWFALVLVLVFAVHLNWLPTLGTGSADAIVLPAVALGSGYAAVLARLLRNSLLEVYAQPYIVAARARGLSGRRILLRHAMQNAAIPVITILGLQFGNMLAGAVVIEVIFGRPGIGTFLVDSIQAKDIPAVQGIVLFVAVLYLLINLAVDLGYGLLDPRIRRRSA